MNLSNEIYACKPSCNMYVCIMYTLALLIIQDKTALLLCTCVLSVVISVHIYLNVKNNLGHESSQGHEELNVSHKPLDGLLEQLLLQANRVVTHLRLGDLFSNNSSNQTTFHVMKTSKIISSNTCDAEKNTCLFVRGRAYAVGNTP